MKKPLKNQIINTYSQDIEETLATGSWGHYDKDNKWGNPQTNKVFTGKVVREWILSKAANEAVIVYPENFIAETSDNASLARESLKNVKYEVRNSNGEKIFDFWTTVQEFKLKDYPTIYYLNSNEDILDKNESEILSDLGTGKNSSKSYSISLSNRFFYLLLPVVNTFRILTSNLEYIEEEEFTKSDKEFTIQDKQYDLWYLDLYNLPLTLVTCTLTIN